MAEDQIAQSADEILEETNWGAVGSDTQFAGPPPFLGVIIVDEFRPSTGENRKSSHYFEFDVLDVRSRNSFVHRNAVNYSAQAKSKLGLTLAALRKVFPRVKFRICAAQNYDMKTGVVTPSGNPSQLIGRVAWFERNDTDLSYGKQTYAYTKALRAATSEETAEALELFKNYVPAAADDGRVAESTTQAAFDWTPEAVDQAIAVLVGQTSSTKLKAARSVEDAALKSQLMSGAAEEYLQAQGFIAPDGSGVYQSTKG